MKVKKLKNHFFGVGEVKGFEFTLVERNDQWLIYRVDTGYSTHYEGFRYTINKNPEIWENEYTHHEVYPGSNSFGVWAWTSTNIEKLKTILNEKINLNQNGNTN